MNIPNKLTVLRIFLIPAFIAVLFIDAIPCRFLIAAAIFAIASITDTLDGFIARRYDMVTDFGKLLDPLADKVLVCSALLCVICCTESPLWRMLVTLAAIVIVAREFLVTSLRLLVAGKGIVVPAGILGKLKTTIQLFAIIAILVELQFEQRLTESLGFAHWVGYILLAAAVAAAIASCIQYVCAYGSHLDPKK